MVELRVWFYDGPTECNKMSISLHSKIVHRLGEAIVAGRYLSEKAMPPEPLLCAQLGVSRTVLREAVKSLMAKGLLSTGPKVGTRVMPHEHWNWLDPDVLAWQFRVGLTAEFLHSVTELRRVVEPPSLRLAAQRITTEQLAEIEQAFARMQHAVATGVDDLTDDLRFHHLLLKASGNRLLVQMSKLLRALLRAAFDRLGRRPAVPDSSLPWHAEVLQALRARDADRAHRAMRALIDAVDDDLAHLLRAPLPPGGAAASA